MSNPEAHPDPGGDPDGVPPFGLPVLAEIPELAQVLTELREVDRLLAGVIDSLVLMLDSGIVESATGVALDQWLAIVARRTRSDVRMLRGAVRACRRLPSLHAAFSTGRISWAQLRTIAIQADKASTIDDQALDAAVADAITTCDEDAHPDSLGQMVSWAIDALRPPPDPDRQPKAAGDGFFALQPRLDGTGGSGYLEMDALTFALVDAATAPTSPPKVGPTRDRFGGPTDPEAAAEARQVSGRERLANLVARLAHSCSSTSGSPAVEAEDAGTPEAGSEAGPACGPTAPLPDTKLLLRAELDTVLHRSGLAAQLFTTLAGGVMHVDAATARKLAEHASTVRLIITDQGRVVGVGRQTNAPPHWLRDASLALHDTCTGPGCLRPALTAHLDHAIPWEDGGATDVANCGPLCGHDNLHKERDGWRATGEPDGTRRWHHPRSGLTVTTHPASARPQIPRGSELRHRRTRSRPPDEVHAAPPLPPRPPPPAEPDA
jgi:hypothetical protein